jgi:tRNA(Ile)-lysidine synthase
MGYFSEISQLVDDICSKEVENVLIRTGHDDPSIVARIDIDRLMSNVNWRYILYHILEPYGFSSSVLSSVEDLLTSDRTVSGKRFEASDHVLVTGRGVLTVCSSEGTAKSTMQSSMMPVRCAGTYHFNGSALDVEVIEWTSDIPLRQPEGVLLMDAEKMRFPFVLRLWRNGDWFVPFGMKGRKKVSDLFADLKFNSLQKDSAVILVDTFTEGLAEQQHIAALLGHRIDDRYKVTSTTRTVIMIVCGA